MVSGLGLLVAASPGTAASPGPTGDGWSADAGAEVGDAAPAPWVSLLVALERGHRPGIEELPQLAAVLADAPEEVLIVWDRQGRFLFHAVGDSQTVRIPRPSLDVLEGSVAIHNHPSGSPPSLRDLDTVLRYRLARMYVAARVEGVISLTDIDHDEAVQRWRPSGPLPIQPTWRPVTASAAPLAIGGPAVVAARIAHGVFGAWL